MVVSIFFVSNVEAQNNLVLNPSFEEIDTCPFSQGQINIAFGWDTLIIGGGSPDVFHNCCTFTNYCGIPNNWQNKGFQYPKNGNSYSGVVATTSFLNGTYWREYMQGTINNQLNGGNEYCVKFYVSLSNVSKYSCNSVGAYFDNGTIQTGNYSLPIQPVTPQILISNIQLDDTLNWVAIEGSFTANGTEQYITIGNFFPDSLSGIQPFPNGTGPLFFEGSYYYIDDVSVIDISTPAFAGNDTSITAGDSIYLGRPSEIGLDEACVWFINGIPIDTLAGIMVAPDSTTTYILQQTICGNVQYDSVTVTVDKGTGISTLNKKDHFEVYPNPSNGDVWLKLEDFIDHAELKLYNINGMMVHQERIYNPGIHKIIYEFENGVYVFSLKTKRGTIEEKVVIIR